MPRESDFRRLRWLVQAVALIVILLPASGDADELNHAGVVVRQADGSLTYAFVPFSEETITGLELIERTGLPISTVSFGGLGQAVCGIDDRGCVPSECRKRVCQGSKPDDPFWQYFRQQSPGVWASLALGASATNVQDGDVDGWSWTGAAANLPALTIADVMRLSGAEAATDDGVALARTAGSQADRAPDQPKWVYLAAMVLLGVGLVGALRLGRGRRMTTT